MKEGKKMANDATKKTRGFLKEFKEFAMKGNMIDLAVGTIIGAAFKDVVTSLTDNLINPIISVVSGGVDLRELWIVPVGKEILDPATGEVIQASFKFGAFASSLISFLLMALVIFLLVKGINKLRNASDVVDKKRHPEDYVEEPTTKICPFCRSEIDIKATRCPHCTSELPPKSE